VHTFSVVIATRNRQSLLGATLDALAQQDWPADRVEIIVADNGSTDDTVGVVTRAAARRGAPLVRYLYVAEPGKSAAVNQALALTAGQIIAFTDDDVRPDVLWLRALAAAFDDSAVDFVAGRVLPNWESAPPAWMSPALYGVLAIPDNGLERLPISAQHPEVIPIGANMAVRRSVVERIGGLRVDLGKLEGTLRTGEDHEFYLRMVHAGFRGVYEPAALVHHRVGAERLERDYFRRWLHQNGRDVARLEQAFPPATSRRLLRAPAYLWRRAAGDAAAALGATARGDRARRFDASTRLLWFAGYLRESWLGRPATVRPEASRKAGYASQAS
jgi:glycosyltransferase involved in cell wall biosynthesis